MSWPAKKESINVKLADYSARKSTASITIEQLAELRTDYQNLRSELTTYLREQANRYDLVDKLQQMGKMQVMLRELEKERDQLKTEVDTAIARSEVLRTKNQNGNRHTLYLLDRPVRPGMIPYLWAISVLFVGVAMLLFYRLTPALLLSAGETGMGGVSSVQNMLYEVFTNRYTWMALFGAAAIVILFLSLKIAGILK